MRSAGAQAPAGRGRRRARGTSPWVGFAIRRGFGLLVAVFFLVVVTFAIVHLIPGDPARAVAGADATSDQVAQIRHDMGLDRPLWLQFTDYVWGLLHGDMGQSLHLQSTSVASIVFTRLPFTLEVAAFAIVITLVLAVPLGMAVGVLTRGDRRRWLDTGFSVVAGFFGSVPQYVLGTFLVLIFAIGLGWFPTSGAATMSSLILPSVSLAVGPTCTLARVVRRETARVLEQDYMRTARGWRLGAVRTYLRYALPNLLTSTLTLGALVLTGMLGGAVIMEFVFAWPGLGSGIQDAIINKDFPVIQGIILCLGLIATGLNLLVDVVLGIVDPRTLGGKNV